MSSFRRSTVLFVLHTWGTSKCLTFGLALFCSKTALSQWYFSSEAAASDISKLWITLGWICWIYCSREMERVGWPPQLPTVPPGPQVENDSTPMTNDHPYLILLASFIIYAWWLNFHRCSCSPLRYFFHCSNLRSLRSSSRQGFPVSIISIHRDAGDRTNQTGKMAVVQPSRQHPLIWVWVGISLEWGWSQFHRRKAYYNSRTSSFCKGLGQIDTNLAVGSTFSMTLPKIEWSNVTNCQSIVDSLDPYQLGQFQKPQLFDDYMGTYITQIYIAKDFQTPVVPHKAVAEVSKIGNLSESLAVVNHGWQNEPTDGSWFYLSVYPSVCLSVCPSIELFSI